MKRGCYCIAIAILVTATSATAQYAVTGPTPRGNAAYWIDVQETPPALLKKLKKKTIKTRFTLSVSATGRPTGCTHDGKKKLEQQFGDLTCSQLMRRARFNPAKDAQGSPVESTYSSIATWERPSKLGLK